MSDRAERASQSSRRREHPDDRKPRKKRKNGALVLYGASLNLTLWAASFAHAQETEPVPPPAVASEPAQAPPPSEAPAPTSDTAPQPVVNEPEEPLHTPEAEEPKIKLAPALKIGIGVRTGLDLSLNNSDDEVRLSLHDGLGSQFTVRPYFSGQLNDHVGVTANFEALAFSIHAMDVILQLKFWDELQLWIGQHIPANDRTAFCGPFYHNGWNFPITVQSYPFDHDARDRGFTFWGLIADGLIKYHLSLVDLQTGRAVENARLGGRVTLNLLDPENYYYFSGTYHGAQDTLALGAVFQYQKGVDGVADPMTGAIAGDADGDGKLDNDFVGFSFDLLFEKNLDAAGTITLEGGYWNFESAGEEYLVNQGTSPGDLSIGFSGPQPGSSYMVALSWLAHDKLGIGQLQPNARFQMGDYANEQKVYDVGLAYIVDGFNHRWHINYRHVDQDGNDSDVLQMGAQVQL